MSINRRTAVKNLLIISGGMVLIPSCLTKKESSGISLKNFSLKGEEENLLAEIAGTIIPLNDTPGAKELFTHIYTLKMIDDCVDDVHQKEFLSGLKEFNGTCQKNYNKTFLNLNAHDREAFLNDIEQKKYPSKNLSSFYGMMKHYTIQGYMSSKYVGTNLVIYELVPGRFHGTFPIKINA